MSADLGAPRDAVLGVGQLLTAFPEIQELHINPFVAGPTAATSVAVDGRITLK